MVAANAAVREYTEALRGALAAVSRSGRLRALLLAVRGFSEGGRGSTVRACCTQQAPLLLLQLLARQLSNAQA